MPEGVRRTGGGITRLTDDSTTRRLDHSTARLIDQSTHIPEVLVARACVVQRDCAEERPLSLLLAHAVAAAA